VPYARHQTFHLRDGWIRKGLVAVREDPLVFLAPDAADRLGLGVNMVEALRFWLAATGVSKDVHKRGPRSQQLTRFGELVLQYDPYLEADGTLWLLHAHLVRGPDGATTWYWFFNHFARLVFDRATFLSELDLWVRVREGRALSRSTLRHDFDCLIHTYLPGRRGASPEDTIECPLAALQLLTAADEGQRMYRLVRPLADRVEPLAVLHTMLTWQEAHRPTERHVGLADVLRQPGNAGRVFALSATALSDVLVRLEDRRPDLAVRLTRTAGLDTLRLPDASAAEVLTEYFAALPSKESA
jgi:hypothetical protein